MNARSTLPVYEPSIWPVMFCQSGRRGYPARWGRPTARGHVRLASADPSVQPSFNYCYLQHPNDIRRVREGLRLAARLLESDAYEDVADYRIHPASDILANDDAL